MSNVPVRSAEPGDLGWMLELNTRFEALLSPLDRAGIEALVGASFAARVAEPRAALLIAFDQSADYDSPNFLWFRERYPKFVYVDRVAVNPDRGLKGVGTALYDDLSALARSAGYPMICAEVNTDPPNDQSIAFHQRRGFATVGEARLEDRGKSVRYFARDLGAS